MTTRVKKQPTPISSSHIGTMLTCPKEEYWSYVEGLKGEATAEQRRGDLFHRTMECFHQPHPNGGYLMAAAMLRAENLDRTSYLQARGMFDAYYERYRFVDVSEWETVATEWQFTTPIYHPRTGRKLTDYCLTGYIDRIVRNIADGKLYVWEYKTKQSIDAGYIASLWTQRQTALYTLAVEKEFGEPVGGVIYDLVQRPSIKPKDGETAEEFESRCQTLKHPDKATQKTGETDAEYLARLAAWYADPAYMRFHRETIVYTPDDIQAEREKLFEQVQLLRYFRRTGTYPRNCYACYPLAGKPCAYTSLCAAADPSLVLAQWRENMTAGAGTGTPMNTTSTDEEFVL